MTSMREDLKRATDVAELLGIVRGHIADFESDAHKILSQHEAATRSRVITIEQTRRQLHSLSARQQQLLDEALSCIEYGLFRAAHVAAWQAFIDFLVEKMASDGLDHIRAVRSAWKYETLEELLESVAEHQLIEVAKDMGLINKGEMKALHGELSTRNQCAHPSDFHPNANEALGYVSGLLRRMVHLQEKALKPVKPTVNRGSG